jgi:hypothetical protein
LLADKSTDKLDTATAGQIYIPFHGIVEKESQHIDGRAGPLVDEYVDGVLQLSHAQIMARENPPS